MKRKISEPNPEPPLPIGIPSRQHFHAIRSSDSRFPITTDISCKKGRKFTDPDGENQRPRHCEFAEADNAKTSEYAFFKKLKEGACHKAHSSSLRNEVCQTKNFKSRECSGERINMVQDKSEVMWSSLLNENATLELNVKRAYATLEDVHWKQNDIVEEYENGLRTKGKRFSHFEDTETQNWRADVFCRKRQKLRQWVAETSFPEIVELDLNGNDVVSVLLSRLIPKCNENNKFKDSKLMQAGSNDKSMSLPSYESDLHFRKLQSTPAINFMELECGSCLHDNREELECWSKRFRERIFCFDSPTSYVYKNRLQYRVREPGSELLGGNAISCGESDSHSVLPLKEYGLVTSDLFKEIDVFSQSNEYLVERQLHVPMLGWDFESRNENRNLSKLSRHRAEHTSTSFASYHNHDVVRNCLEGNSVVRSGFHQTPLSLSCIPNFINVSEDCIDETSCEVGGTIFSLPNDHWITSTIINEGHYIPTTESILSSGLDSNLGWKYLLLSGSWREHYSSTCHALQFPEDISSHLRTYNDNKYERSLDEYSSHTRSLPHFNEDNVGIHDCSAFGPQISLDREKAWPLLLDKSSWNGSSEREMDLNFDDCQSPLDVKVNFLEWLHME